MSLFTKTAEDTFAPYDSAGNPREIVPQEAQVWGSEVERLITSFQAGGGIIFPDKATMDATLTYAANQMAWVMGDGAGIYRKIGASGTGSWQRLGDLPYSFVKLVDVGAGTANAIQLASAIPTSPSVLRVANIFEANTGNVTVSENGAAAKSLLTNSGNQIAPGGLTAGMMITYVDDGAAFRLLNDQVSAAIVAAAEALLEEFQSTYLGAYASDPTTDPNGNPLIVGAFYFNTTSNQPRIWNGTVFVPIQAPDPYASQAEAAAGTATNRSMNPLRVAQAIEEYQFQAQNTGATSKSSVTQRYGDVPNLIRDFGAPTDGSDCSAAFNTALTQVAANGGKELFVPAATYTWTGGAVSMRKLKLRGAGMDTARIVVKKTNSTIFRFDTVIGYPEISDLHISQDAATPATAGAAFHFTEKGVLGPKLARIKTNDLWQAMSCDVGVGSAGAGVNGAVIEDCSFDGCKKYGWYLIGAVNWVFKGGYTTMSSFASNTAACVLDSNCEGILLSQHFALAGEYPFIMQNSQSGGVPPKECMFSQFTFDGGAGASAAAKIAAGRRNHFAQCWVSNQNGVGIDWNNPSGDASALLGNSWVGGTLINIGRNAMELHGKVNGLRVIGAHFGSWGLLAANTYSGVYATADVDTAFDISHNFFGDDDDVPANSWNGITVNSGTYRRYIITRNMNLGLTGSLVSDGGTASVAKDVSTNL
ncbi:hypothetical protein M728_000391 [Ensifer sp. WSM1721]|uniref:glycosyl hydrolase family 28-related protein n=1 Tax=Ensifer sp. WSM1721 TaxID=1041159 RepID=UPI000478DAC1|nr:glycosyl hydrolase family 28-related protein [Ensifer sp. WSM1721]